MTASDVLTFLGGPVAGAAAAKLWQWWTEREKATREVATARVSAAIARDSDASAALVAELKASRDAADRRADAAAEGRAVVATALTNAAHAQELAAKQLSDLNDNTRRGADAIVAKVDDLADTVDERLTRVEAQLAELLGRKGVLP